MKRKLFFFVTALVASVTVSAAVCGKIHAMTAENGSSKIISCMWTESLDKNGTYVDKSVFNGHWPYVSQWWEAGNMVNEYTKVDSYFTTIRTKRLNVEGNSTIGFYFSAGQRATHCYFSLANDNVPIYTAGEDDKLMFEIASPENGAAEESISEKLIVTINGTDLVIPANIIVPTTASTITVALPLPIGDISSIRIALDQVASQKFIANLRIEKRQATLLLGVANGYEGMGSVSGSGIYSLPSPVHISAIPNEGYHFVRWSDGNTDNPRTLTLTQDTTLTATFAKDYSGKCGDDLYWQYKDTELKISGTGAMYHYTEATQPWQLFRDSIRAVYTDNTTTSISEYAFANTKRLSKLHIGAKVEDIGAYAFANCSRLYDIYCYAAEPPFAETNSFAYYQAYVRIPCESVRDYTMDLVWQQFENILCLGSEEVVLPSNKVTVTPTETDATFTWPTNDKAESYSLVITKDGVVFCTLTFNGKGQLTGIAFAPARDRDNVHTTPAAKALVNGWQFTVTGLNEKSDYAYTLTVTDKSDKVLKSYEGTFSTLGEDLPEGLNTPTESAANVYKVLRNGQVLIQRGDNVYTLTGQEVVNH